MGFSFPPQVDNNKTLYGVCMTVSEIVQRPPAVLGDPSGFKIGTHPLPRGTATATNTDTGSRSGPGLGSGSEGRNGEGPGLPSRFLAVAPRCYCILSRLPFFQLHFQVLSQ